MSCSQVGPKGTFEACTEQLVDGARGSCPQSTTGDVTSTISQPNSTVSLETLLSCFNPAELTKPSEVRTILPGVGLPLIRNEDQHMSGMVSNFSHFKHAQQSLFSFTLQLT